MRANKTNLRSTLLFSKGSLQSYKILCKPWVFVRYLWGRAGCFQIYSENVWALTLNRVVSLVWTFPDWTTNPLWFYRILICYYWSNKMSVKTFSGFQAWNVHTHFFATCLFCHRATNTWFHLCSAPPVRTPLFYGIKVFFKHIINLEALFGTFTFTVFLRIINLQQVFHPLSLSAEIHVLVLLCGSLSWRSICSNNLWTVCSAKSCRMCLLVILECKFLLKYYGSQLIR